MNRTTAFLVGSEEDRRRVDETEAAVSKARKISVVAIVATLPFIVGTGYGWWPIPLGLAYVAFARLVDHKYATSDNGVAWMFSLTAVTQLMFGIATVATGGPQSPAMLWLVLVMILIPARYGRRGILLGSSISLICVLGAALSDGVAALVDHPEMLLITLSTGISCLAYGGALREGEVQQRRAAVLDPLTGLLNRTNLHSRFEEVRQVAVARGRTVGLVVCDLDHFKAVNDEHGHTVGDAVLVGAAYELRRVLADHELIYRLGGEEFAVVLPDTDLRQAEALAELVRAAVHAARPGGVEVTISCGVVADQGAELDFHTLYDAADAALYRAKRSGRNRVVVGTAGDGRLREVVGAGPEPGPDSLAA